MGAASSASGTGTIRFAGGTESRRARAPATRPGSPRSAPAASWTSTTTGTTGALRMVERRHAPRRRHPDRRQRHLQPRPRSFTEAGVTAFSRDSQTTITGTILLDFPAAGHTLRLNGTTTWSAGDLQIHDAGIVENAGLLSSHRRRSRRGLRRRPDRLVRSTWRGRDHRVSGSLPSRSEIENDGTLRARRRWLADAVQRGRHARPTARACSSPRARGVLSLSNVLMGAASSATGHRHDPASPADPAASRPARATRPGSPRSAPAASSTSTTTGTTGALRMAATAAAAAATARSPSAAASSASRLGELHRRRHDRLLRRLAHHDHRHLLDSLAAGHTLRLNGTTTWSAGTIQIQDAGTVENAGRCRSPAPSR